jgi:PAS domain S-box-containing protein
LLDRILIQVERVVPYESANVMLIESDTARVVQCRGYTQRAFKREDILALRFSIVDTENLRLMVDTGQPFLVSDTHGYGGWQHLEQTAWIRSYIGAPIRIEGDVIGFLNLDNAHAGAFERTHAEKLQAFANQVGIAIQNARLYDAAKDYAVELEERVSERTAQLERQRAQLQTILDAMNDGVVGIMFDADMKPQARLMNRALTRLIGYTSDEWDFNLLRSLNTTDEEFAEVVADYGRAIENVGFWQAKLKVRRKDSTEFDGDLTVKRVNDADDNMIGIVIVVRDISQEKLLQEQRSRFVANASHELRTPITNMLTRLYLLRKQPERLPEHLEIMENVTGRMRSLVEDLLEHSRFERGVIPLQRHEVDLRTLLGDVIRLQEPEAHAKNIYMTYNVPELPLIVLVDPGRMIQVFTNLVTNAINYTPEDGSVNIDCLIEDGDLIDAPAAVVHVQDSGIGIPPELLPNIFRPFYRGNEHTQGTGLGLSIAKEIVEMHGGTIAVESQVNGGTHFTVRLALIHPDM